MRLAKAGYYGGDPGAVLRAPVDDVVMTMEYEVFTNDYELTFHELNKETPRK